MNALVKTHVRMVDPVLIIMEVTHVVVERASLGPIVKKVHAFILKFEVGYQVAYRCKSWKSIVIWRKKGRLVSLRKPIFPDDLSLCVCCSLSICCSQM